MTFLKDNYKLPKQKSDYLKLEEGDHTFRILSSAIVGWEYWVEDDKGKRKPLRVRYEKDLPEEAFKQRDDPKHFWAFCIYNRDLEQIQILEITQRTIMTKIERLVRNEKWGDPKEYDLCISRIGQTMMETEYTTMPEPKEKLDKGIKKLYEDMKIDLTELYKSGDPFHRKEKVNPEDVPENLGK